MSSHDYGDNNNAILVEDIGDSDGDTLGVEDVKSSSLILRIILLLISILAGFFFGGSFYALLIGTSHLSTATHLVRMLGSTIAYFLSLWSIMDRFFRILAGVLGAISAIIAALIVSAASNFH